jgi:hypothetical protein
MRKIYLSLAILLSAGFCAQAQLSDGGLPLSMQSQIVDQYIPVNQFTLPDWEAAKFKAEQDERKGIARPYLIALPIAADISFPNSGTIITLANGNQVWRTKVSIENAPAIGFNYDNFKLPEGVKLYLSNANGRHIVGAYSSKNNDEDRHFANEPVQGSMVNIELNIDRGVDLSEINLHIYKIMVYFRSYEYLNQYAGDDGTQAKPTDPDPFDLEGSSSTCGINAICPVGVNYPKQRKATVQILSDGGACSATMINNTGNTLANCKQYLLTATHCDPANSTSDSHFSELLIRFNFEKLQCTGGAPAEVKTLARANFRARANYVETGGAPEINGDFLLLELRNTVPSDWDAYLAGWNRSATVPATLTYPKRYIGFHHPAGDIKKVSISNDISPWGEAGGSMGPGTHWQITAIDSGGVEGGSSGSGLFDGDGRLIGIASVAGDPDVNCGVNGNGEGVDFLKFVNYSKLSLGWNYSLDGPATFRKLQPWLDPANTGVVTLDAVKSNCTGGVVTGIANTANEAFGNSISIYPNPSTTGIVTTKVNFKETTDLTVEVYNVAGAKQNVFTIPNALNGSFTFNLSQYANGMYLLKFSNGSSVTTKKIMLSK